MKGCISGPQMTREKFMWTKFSSILLISLGKAKRNEEIKENKQHIENFLKCLENIDECRIVYEGPLKISHTLNPNITNYDIHLKFSNFLADKNNVPQDKPYRKVMHWESKELSKLLGDLKNCGQNILEEPKKRQKFGHEAKILEEVAKYFETNRYEK